MADIPQLEGQARPLPQPAGGLASYRPDFGGGEQLGQAIEQAGSNISAGGNALEARAKIEQEKIDTLKAEDAFTQLRQTQLDLTVGKDGYANLKGAAAVNTPVYQVYTQKYQDAQQQLEGTLKNSEQLNKFRQRANIAYSQMQENILRHTASEADSYAKEVTDGILQTEVRQATANWESPQDIAVSLTRIDAAIKAQAERSGWPTEFTEAAKLKADGQVHSAIIGQALASGNLVYAKEWYDKHQSDIDAPTAKALETATKNAFQRQINAQYDNAFLAARDDPKQLRALETSVLKDQSLDDTRKNVVHGRILSRMDVLEKRAQMDQDRSEKYIQRAMGKIDSITKSGYEAPTEDVMNLFNLSRGTPMQGEVDQMIAGMNMTRQFRLLSPADQAAELNRMVGAARSGQLVADNMSTFVALRQAIQGRESDGSTNPDSVVSPQGATGKMQITEDTFKQYAGPGESYQNENHRVNAAVRKLADDFQYYGGDIERTAAAYIGGRGSVGPNGVYENAKPDALGTTPKAYAAQVKARVANIMRSTAGVRFDIGLIKNLEAMHEAQKKDIQNDFVTYAVRQGLVKPDDAAAKPLDMSKPESLDYVALQRRIEVANAGAVQYGAPIKPLTEAERDVAVTQLRRLPAEGKAKWMSDVLKAASNNAGSVVAGARNDEGGIMAFQGIMSQIAPDEPVLAHAGVLAARSGPDGQGKRIAELMLQGNEILRPSPKTDGKPDSGKLLPQPPEAKMRLDFDTNTRDAFASNIPARNAAFQSAQAVYAALSAKAGDKNTVELDSARWQQAITMAVGNVHDWNGKYTVLPQGMEYGPWKDGLYERIAATIASGRMDPSITAAKMRNMTLLPSGDGKYVFYEGDKALVDKTGRPVVADFTKPVPWTPPQTVPAAPVPTNPGQIAAENAGAYYGTPRRTAR